MNKGQIRILYIGNALSGHGYTPTSVEYLGQFLEEAGFNVSISSNKKNQFIRFLSMCFATASFTGSIILIDTYSTSAFYYAWICAIIAHRRKIPYIPILHGGDLEQRLTSSPKKCKTLLANSVINVAVSSFLKLKIESRGFKAVEIPNMIRLAEYPLLKRNLVGPRLLWVRAFHNTYNPILALWVFKKLQQDFPLAELTMVGPDKDGSMAEVKQLAKKMHIEGKVHMPGKLSKKDWIGLSVKHDIFINTTNFDNMPVSIIEAMALGLPVVSTNVGGMPYLITDEVDGLLVPPNDVNAFCNAIMRLINDRALATELAKNARLKAKSFDYGVVLEQWKKLIYEVIQKHS